MPQTTRSRSMGQVLILFVLFLLVLLGVSALAIDYATWLVTDRTLQNVSDHAALAGASEFTDRTTATNCSGNKCVNARRQAWTSLNDELVLGLSATDIANLAASDTGSGGVTVPGSTDRFWVTTPPPSYAAYTGAGGRYALNHGVVFVRVDRPVRSFLGGALGITPAPRAGWATAGALPADFALEVFCRNHIAPQGGVCENSAGLTIDGQGGIRLLKGDIGSNESLTVTSNVGQGVQMLDGNVFLVNRSCAPNTWNCPNGPPSLGGINSGAPSYNGKNAFYIAPLPVPHYESPLDYASLSLCPTTAQWNANQVPCVPWRNQYGTDPAPNSGSWIGDWTCNDGTTSCGTPVVSGSSISCTAGAYDPNSRFMRPNADDRNQSNQWSGTQYTTDIYRNINDATIDPSGSLPGTNPGSEPLAGSPTNLVYSQDGRSPEYRVGMSPPQGIPAGADLTVRYVLYKTETVSGNPTPSSSGNQVDVTVQLQEKVGSSYVNRGSAQTHTNIDGTLTVYQYPVSIATIGNFNRLYLSITVSTTQSNGAGAVNNRGAGVSWVEAEIPSLLPPTPPTIKPGYWHSITIPNGGCAILDPSPATGLQQYQLPGIFRFGGGGTGANAPRIVLGSGAFLIGDAVSLVFDPRVGSSGFPDNGIDIGAGGALVINTATASYNPSYPLTDLPYTALNTAWQVDSSDTSNPRDGTQMWPVCTVGGSDCVPRACYLNTDSDPTGVCQGQTVSLLTYGRGISFYFTPNTWTHASANIQRRFQMGGNGEANAPGIAFKAVMYAPYDDVKMSGRNGFNTVGQVLAWTAKFNGGSAYIDLDYPYDYTPAPPYLLEPTIQH